MGTPLLPTILILRADLTGFPQIELHNQARWQKPASLDHRELLPFCLTLCNVFPFLASASV